jgi:protein-S-isoprenylcysteine O-methyltransferase Ste14
MIQARRIWVLAGNLAGATVAVYLVLPNLRFFFDTGRPIGLLLWAWAFSKLARSYGIVPADRGLVTGGPYAFVRHPLYTAYMVGGIGYLIQSLSLWNVLIDVVAVGWQLVRISAEERHLGGSDYPAYRTRVRWRLCPGLW